MSFRTMQRFGFVSALALASVCAAACGDDEDKDTNGNDAGGDGDGKSDAGAMDSGTGLKPLQAMCGTNVCDGVDLPTGFPDLKACCLADNACGIASTLLQGENTPDCVPAAAAGKPSASCAAVWDSVDFAAENGANADAGLGDNMTDGDFDTFAMPNSRAIIASFGGCCTANNTCSISFDSVSVTVMGQPFGAPSNAGYGCPDPLQAGLAQASGPAGFGETVSCNYAGNGEVNEEPVLPGDAGI